MKKMFRAPFSFEGRIRRTEYGLSRIIGVVALMIIALISEAIGYQVLYFCSLIPYCWFTWAQGAKRCHDLGNSGWWQIIPFYGLWLLFANGQEGINEYGKNPKSLNVPEFSFMEQEQV